MFGIFHAGDPAADRACAVLLCNPFGQEAIRVHRFYRVLANRLARAGVSVLRFDPYGTGDSMGDDHELTLDGWRTDLLTAHGELLQRNPAARVRWVGARLGATLALLAADQQPDALVELLLWEPLLDGAAYRALLRRKHAEALAISYGLIGPDWLTMLEDESAFADEAIGFAIAPGFSRELEAIDLRAAAPVGVDVRLLGDPNDGVLSDWVTRCQTVGARIQFTPFVHDFDWTAEEAVNTALVPPTALQYFVTALAS
jgi:uncharacterized protein